MKKLQDNKGFTIIESLVAITILMISIAGPLTIAHKGLLAAVQAHDLVTASYLAQDAMEYLKNVRDNNIIVSGQDNWLDVLKDCVSTTPCSVDTLNGNPSMNFENHGIATCSGDGCVLRKSLTNASDGYSHVGSSKSKYTRYFYLVPRENDIGAESFETEANLVVVVRWNVGVITNEVVYRNEIFNIIR